MWYLVTYLWLENHLITHCENDSCRNILNCSTYCYSVACLSLIRILSCAWCPFGAGPARPDPAGTQYWAEVPPNVYEPRFMSQSMSPRLWGTFYEPTCELSFTSYSLWAQEWANHHESQFMSQSMSRLLWVTIYEPNYEPTFMSHSLWANV